jgi:2-amino-4-hydroxy-6-hydroxymethyldihydropteridine diphosphokinase
MRRSTTEAAHREPVLAYIGLGANLGDARATLAAAFAAIERLPRTELTARSALYRSAPIDSSGPDYLNAVVAVRTRLDAQALLAGLQAIEREHGRERPYRNAPRSLDLDLLLYGQRRLDAPNLTVPHPRMHERAFVLRPLADIAPDLVIPGHGPLAPLLEQVAEQRIERVGD